MLLFKINLYAFGGYFVFLLLVFHKLLETDGCFMLKIDFDAHDSFVCDNFMNPN
jgi:hypothetical protein